MSIYTKYIYTKYTPYFYSKYAILVVTFFSYVQQYRYHPLFVVLFCFVFFWFFVFFFVAVVFLFVSKENGHTRSIYIYMIVHP